MEKKKNTSLAEWWCWLSDGETWWLMRPRTQTNTPLSTSTPGFEKITIKYLLRVVLNLSYIYYVAKNVQCTTSDTNIIRRLELKQCSMNESTNSIVRSLQMTFIQVQHSEVQFYSYIIICTFLKSVKNCCKLTIAWTKSYFNFASV